MLTKERAEQLIRCDFDTGELFWLYSYQRPDVVGQRAGWARSGYWWINLDGQDYYVCHIIWLCAYGELPNDTLDHKNNRSCDDSLENLRLATKGQNAANSSLNIRNSSGLKGASYCNTTGRWRASIKTHGISRNLGRYDTAEEAHEAWRKAAIEAYGEEFVRAT